MFGELVRMSGELVRMSAALVYMTKAGKQVCMVHSDSDLILFHRSKHVFYAPGTSHDRICNDCRIELCVHDTVVHSGVSQNLMSKAL